MQEPLEEKKVTVKEEKKAPTKEEEEAVAVKEDEAPAREQEAEVKEQVVGPGGRSAAVPTWLALERTSVSSCAGEVAEVFYDSSVTSARFDEWQLRTPTQLDDSPVFRKMPPDVSPTFLDFHFH